MSAAEASVLQRGLQFSVTPRHLPITNIISEVENGCSTLPAHEKSLVRAQVCKILLNCRMPKPNLSREERDALRVLKNDDSLVILNADKGACTVIMDKVDYDRKLLTLLEDAGTYMKLKKDPTKTNESKMNALLLKIKREGQLEDGLYFRLRSTDALSPRLYGLIKIHKENFPVRPIVSFSGAATLSLSRYLSDILSPLLGQTLFTVRNSAEFVECLKETEWRPGDVMISCDVVSLFTKIPVQRALQIAKEKITNDPNFSNRTSLSIVNFMSLLELCLNSSDFSFRNTFYRQTFGCPMGSPISMAMANLVMEDLESRIFCNSNDVHLWRRFVDDTFVILPENYVSSFFSHINSLEESITFTMEKECDACLSFLDVRVRREADFTLSTQVFRKPTSTNRYLQFDSHHPLSHKRAVFRTLMDRAGKVSSNDDARINEIKYVKDTLVQNGYPRHFLHSSQRSVASKPIPSDSRRITIPYIQGISERISRALFSHGLKVSYRCFTKLRSFFPSPKDSVSPFVHCGVVYQINCKDCSKSYVGQTKNSLNTRLGQHRAALRLVQAEKSALAEHSINSGHQIEWCKPAILEKEPRWRNRLFLEAWHSGRFGDQCLNRTECPLPSVYRALFNPPQGHSE